MTGQPIAARRIQEAILDEIDRQAREERIRDRPAIAKLHGEGQPTIQVEGTIDVQAIAIAVANLVNDR